ncbi:MAG TPA: hypothetical protein DD411_06270 [Alcanivorax sp.]|jgi:hypothetical protein|nr:hypothetical protein [Alcanivorax sp.]|tara:strand:+ start:1029 stop:1265 length:237 start_codon:yes stop_codon:yes gene_type:complete
MRELKKWADSRPDLVLLARMIADFQQAEGRDASEFFRWRLTGYLNALWDTKVINDAQWDWFGAEVSAFMRKIREAGHV